MKIDECTALWEDYRKAKEYTQEISLCSRIKTNVDFYEGRQWAPATRATRSMPRPVVNMIKFICRNKRAALTATPVRLVYSSHTAPQTAAALTDLSSYLTRKMDMEELDSKAIRDGILKGSYFYHLFSSRCTRCFRDQKVSLPRHNRSAVRHDGSAAYSDTIREFRQVQNPDHAAPNRLFRNDGPAP